MNKKGFTLVELLTVILVLGIVFAIAIPFFGKLINDSKRDLYYKIVDSVIINTKQYLAENSHKLPIEEGDTTEVTINNLIEEGYIKALKNPYIVTQDCTGYVIVTKISDVEFDYIPHINCYENINNSEEDGLILHYTFSDFQEPTQNLVIRPEFNDTNLGSPWGSWESSVLTFESVSVIGFKTISANLTKRTSGTTNAIHQSIGSLQVGTPYTLSFYARINPNSVSSNGKIRAYINEYVDYPITKEWERISLTRTAITTPHVIHITQYNAEYDVQIAHVQFENKLYATPFVSGSRTSIVKDSSGKNNNATLTLNYTPRWTDKGYYFDGSKYFDTDSIGNTEITNEMTVMGWIKVDNLPTDIRNGTILGNYNKPGHFNIESYYGKLRFYWNNGEIDIRTSADIRDRWVHFAVTRDKLNERIIIYIDGEIDRDNYNAGTNININYPFRVGADFRAGATVKYSGYLGNISIYKRALSQEEIKAEYNLSKDKYK